MEAALGRFADRNSEAAWAEAELAYAVRLGLLLGRTDNQLAPLATATRAEAIVLLQRLLDAWWAHDPTVRVEH